MEKLRLRLFEASQREYMQRAMLLLTRWGGAKEEEENCDITIGLCFVSFKSFWKKHSFALSHSTGTLPQLCKQEEIQLQIGK